MKNIFILYIAVVTCLVAAGDLRVDTRTDFRLLDFEREKIENLTRLYFSEEWDDVYGEITLKNHYRNDNETFSFDRAFIEIYRENITFTMGKQRIYWGLANIFNSADIFNTVDFTRPKEERDGVKALKLRYNPDYTSRIELAYADLDATKNDFAFRYTFTHHGVEYMFNFLSQHRNHNYLFPSLFEKTRHFVLEAKGELVAGIWGSVDFKQTQINQELSLGSVFPARNNVYVLGLDYTFDLTGHNLYSMLETIYDSDSDELAIYYMHTYDLTDVLFLSQSLMKASAQGSLYIGNALEYIYSDFVTLRLELNFFDDFQGSMIGTEIEDIDTELKFTVKGSF